METQYKYKLGTHRQNRRIWIEGKRLSNNGFVKDKRYNVRPGHFHSKATQEAERARTHKDVKRFPGWSVLAHTTILGCPRTYGVG